MSAYTTWRWHTHKIGEKVPLFCLLLNWKSESTASESQSDALCIAPQGATHRQDNFFLWREYKLGGWRKRWKTSECKQNFTIILSPDFQIVFKEVLLVQSICEGIGESKFRKTAPKQGLHLYCHQNDVEKPLAGCVKLTCQGKRKQSCLWCQSTRPCEGCNFHLHSSSPQIHTC